MIDLPSLVKTALMAHDKAKERSLQVELGASSVFGCRRQAWSIINQVPKVNTQTESLAATIGTAVHSTMADAMKNADPLGDDFLIENMFSTPELKGHCDLFIKSTGSVVDWKTTTKKNMSKFPSTRQRMQVQLYGYLIEESGYEVNDVSLVAIPRDGWYKDIKSHTEPYDRAMALEGIQWVKDVKAEFEAPEPELSKYFCQDFCEFYDESGMVGCQGK